MELKKKIVKEVVFHKTDYRKPIQFGEIDIELQPIDVIIQQYNEPFYSENESWDGHWYLEVSRERLETDDEYQKRMEEEKEFKEEMKKRRYENYLKLKKEFEKNNNG